MEQRHRDLGDELASLLSQHRRFTWEIGCGHGHFLTAYAQAHPDRLCVGIDLVGERIARACRKRDRARLSNLFFLRAEAALFLAALPGGARFERLFILFPDPWPKLRHHKHRILKPDFLTAASPHATTDSRLYFRTDFTSYFSAAQSVVRGHDLWRLGDDPWEFEASTVFQERAAHYQSFVARHCPAPPRTIS